MQVRKIGEGTYGEAFKCSRSGSVFKIVPCEGERWINDAPQKPVADLMGEAVIALTLSKLRESQGQGAESCHKHRGWPACAAVFAAGI